MVEREETKEEDEAMVEREETDNEKIRGMTTTETYCCLTNCSHYICIYP